MKTAEIQKLVNTQMSGEFAPLGFSGKKSSLEIKKDLPNGSLHISSVVKSYGTFPKVEFFFSVRITEVEDLVKQIRTKVFPKNAFAPLPDTLDFLPKEFMEDPSHYFEIQGEDYISMIVKNLKTLFLEQIEPFVNSHTSDLEKLDALLNAQPLQSIPWKSENLERAYRGLAIRYLHAPAGLSELTEEYRGFLKDMNKGGRNLFEKFAAGFEALT